MWLRRHSRAAAAAAAAELRSAGTAVDADGGKYRLQQETGSLSRLKRNDAQPFCDRPVRTNDFPSAFRE